MTVLVNRVDLFDSGCHRNWHTNSSNHSDDEPKHQPSMPDVPVPPIASYRFEPTPTDGTKPSSHHGSVAVVRAPHSHTLESQRLLLDPANNPWMQIQVLDEDHDGCPHQNSDLAKYWVQRRRLFRLFDHGIQLDESGWFSVTPEQIADHTAICVQDLLREYYGTPNPMSPPQPLPHAGQPQPQDQWVILDAFGGCGGNAIAFAKLIPNALVVAVEMNRSKLLMAAKNASIYQIPSDKIVFCECNALFVLEHCYRNGRFILDEPLSTPEAAMALMQAMPPPVETIVCHDGGYMLGGIDVLPSHVNLVYMDPPWGGVDYSVLGRNGYDLTRNMWIERSALSVPPPEGSLEDAFFDTFHTTPRTKAERKAQFNCEMDISNSINGAELLALAAQASDTHMVVYDLPRNINRGSLGSAALAAGYRGNCKLEEHYLNGRLKTVTAYFGSDWSGLVRGHAETTE